MARGDARQRICETAVRLFNERGVDAVGLRQVAAEAGTTIGNLTYHFAHKEDLLAAILTDLHEGFSDLLDRSLGGEELLGRLARLVAENARSHDRYPFYFDNLSQVTAESSVLRAENEAFQLQLLDYYRWALASLEEQGWMRPTSEASRESVALALVCLQASWGQASSPYRNSLMECPTLPTVIFALLRTHVAEGFVDRFDEICAGKGTYPLRHQA